MIKLAGLTTLREHLAKEGKVELSLGCHDIPKMDLMSPSDPFCIIFARNATGWEKIGTTETIKDTSTCKWVWKLNVGETMACSELKFEVYDRDSDRDVLKDHDFIGYVDGIFLCSLLEQGIHYQRVNIARKDSKKNLGCLSLILDWIERPVANYRVVFAVSTDFHPRRKIYYEVSRKCWYGSQYALVFRSNVLDRKSCRFEDSKLSLMQLGATSRSLRIEFFESLPFCRSKTLGFVRTSIDELLKADLNTPLRWTSCHKDGLQNPRLSVTQEDGNCGSVRHFFIHISS